jgi:two-component system sensor histidine kinase/response regulator
MMGGEIWVESEPGRGSTFCFTANFGLGKEIAKKRFKPSKDLRGIKVLVIDDNATSREILKDMLESFTFEVSVAASGPEGIAELEAASKDKPFELVIMDWKMPDMDGIEASQQIKDRKNLSKIPPIIMVTAYGREEVMQQAEQVGLDGFLLKPVSASMLFDAIMQAFGEAVPETSRVAQKHEQEAEALEYIRGAHVLLVEDNEINQQVAKEILEGVGLIVTVANNGQEAVDAVKTKSYDAVLMDVQMPVMDGYTATRKIREWETEVRGQNTENIKLGSVLSPQSSGLPIIAMTAHAMAGDEDKSLQAGMNGHVTKPIDPDQLFATLQQWIKPVAKRTPVQKPSLQEAQAKADRVQPVEDDLPQFLPGFDLATGLSRLMGNKRLYRKLLLDFGTNYRDVADEIREALAARNFTQAHSLVHNLKGLAGNLAATDLQAAAVAMEKLVKGPAAETASGEKLDRKLADLESALELAMDAVQILGPVAEKKTIESLRDEMSFVPPELARKVADRITAAADMGDVMQVASIAKKLKLENDVLTPFCDKIIRLSEDFDLEGILKLAKRLISAK